MYKILNKHPDLAGNLIIYPVLLWIQLNVNSVNTSSKCCVLDQIGMKETILALEIKLNLLLVSIKIGKFNE